jgi:hypothetical protein
MKNRSDNAPLIEYRPHPELLYQFPVILAAPNMSHKLALIVKMEAHNEVVITEYYFTCKKDIGIDDPEGSLEYGNMFSRNRIRKPICNCADFCMQYIVKKIVYTMKTRYVPMNIRDF